MKKIEITRYSLAELEDLINSREDYKVGIRLMACIKIAKGASSRDIDDFYDMSYSRICHWVKQLNEKGISGLKNAPKPGRKSGLSQQELEKLKRIILKESPADYGYSQKIWNGVIITQLINKEFNCNYKKAAVYLLLARKLGLHFYKGQGFISAPEITTKNEVIA